MMLELKRYYQQEGQCEQNQRSRSEYEVHGVERSEQSRGTGIKEERKEGWFSQWSQILGAFTARQRSVSSHSG